MISEVEIVRFLIALGVMVFIYIFFPNLKKEAGIGFLLWSYIFLMIGWIFTILEGFYLPEILNFVEHLFYTASAISLFIWTYKKFYCGKVGS